MVGRAPTRQRYLDLVLAARSDEDQDVVRRSETRFWNTWAKEQKEDFITHLNYIDLATERANAAEQDVLAKIDDYELNINGRNLRARRRAGLRVINLACAEAHRTEVSLETALNDAHQFYHNMDIHMDVCREALLLLGRCRQRITTKHNRMREWQREQRRDANRPNTHLQRYRLSAFHDIDTIRSKLLSRNAPDNYSVDNVLAHLEEGHHASRPYQLYWGDSVLITVWKVFNEKNELLRSVVRKDVKLTSRWYDIHTWVGDARSTDRTASELYIHDLLCNTQTHPTSGRSNILPIFPRDTAGVDNDVQILTMWTELAPYGTLDLLIDAFAAHTSEFVIVGAMPEVLMPEPFIWYVVLTLVECGLAMQYGSLQQVAQAPEGWNQIVHLDIKPGNIFLNVPDPSRFPGYPQPQLGDFGLAVQTWEGDRGNPDTFPERGTNGWTAPEQTRWIDNQYMPVDRYELSSKTDVHAVGLIIHKMIKLNELAAVDHRHRRMPRSTPEYHQPGRYQHWYSRELLALAERCLRIVPDNRPTFRELHDDVMNVLVNNRNVTPHIQTVRDVYNGTIDVKTERRLSVFAYPSPRNRRRPLEQYRTYLPYCNGDERFMPPGRGREPSDMALHDLQCIAPIGYEAGWR